MELDRLKQSLIFMDNVYQQYPDGKGGTNLVLNDIDLAVGNHEFVTIVGPSGCGKSTLLRMLLGSEKPASGTLLMEGKPMELSDRNRGIVFQRYSLFPHMTVLENVTAGLLLEHTNMPMRLLNTPEFRRLTKQYSEAAEHYIEKVGLIEHTNKYPNQLSGGQKQRIAIAQALIMRPKVLLMDEPFGALDDTTRQSMQLFILEMWKEIEDMTIFFVTHELEEAIYLATRVIVLSQFYSTDKGASQGSKIVIDHAILGDHPKSMEFKYSPDFSYILKMIRHYGLDPKVKQHISEFNLCHPLSFRTVKQEEWKDAGN